MILLSIRSMTAVMPVTSFLAPGLYDGVEWTFYPDNFGRIPGFANPEFEEFDPVYIAIFLRSVKIALITVAATLLVCDPAAFHVSRLPEKWKNFCLLLITLPFFSSLIVRLFIWVLIGAVINAMLTAEDMGGTAHDRFRVDAIRHEGLLDVMPNMAAASEAHRP